MKKSILLLFAVLIECQLLNAQNLTPTLANGTFIEGMTGVINGFSFNDGNPHSSGILFEAKNGTGALVDSYTDNTSTGLSYTWIGTDMGALNLNSTIIITDVSTSSVLVTYTLNIVAKPQWITQGGTAVTSTITGNNITFTGTYPISIVNEILPSNLTGIGGKSIDLNNCRVEFTADYDFQTTVFSNITTKAKLELNTLNQLTLAKQIPLNGLVINPQCELALVVMDSLPIISYDVNFPSMRIPVCPAVSIKIDVGISFLADLKGQVVLTQNGFGNVSGRTTKIIARLQANGFIRSGVSVLFGAASATARLDVIGKIGIGMDYVSYPSTSTTPLFGGTIDVTGQVDLETFWGFGPNQTYGPKTFYTDSFGNYSAVSRHIASSFDSIFKSKSKTYNINGTLVVPSMHSMPSFATRGNLLYTTWIERNPTDSSGYLLFNSLDTTGGCFTNDIVIEHNDYSMSNPKMAIMPSGKAIITWAQNRYNSSTYPSTYNANSVSALLNSQDLWVAIYDTVSKTINKYRMGDDTTTLNSGRAEGEPKITMGSGNQGLITWVSKDPVNPESDVMFSTVNESNNILTLTTPQILYNVGVNKDVHVSYSDNTNAIAVWINDPDGADTTLNNNVMFSEWNGINWNVPTNLTTNIGNTSYEELSLDYNANFCGVAWTSTIVKPNYDFEKRIDVEIWNDATHQWDITKKFSDTDSMYYFQKPRISISDEGIACVAYQAVDMFPSPNYIDPGQLNLYLNNLPTYSTSWTGIDGNTIVADTNTFIWSIDAGFGNNNVLYTITQEYNSTGAITSPSNGILFGDHSLSMVFRAIQVDHSLSISNATEPNCNVPAGIIENSELKYDFDLMQNYPNPLSDRTLIEFRTQKEGRITLTVRDIFGRSVAIKLLDKELSSGIYQTVFETNNLESGIYFYTLTVNGVSMTKRMIIAK